jgi:hypothetical protein
MEMKKLLVGLIVLAALLSVPMAVSAVENPEKIVQACIAPSNTYVDLLIGDPVEVWEMTNGNGDNTWTDPFTVDADSNGYWTVAATSTGNQMSAVQDYVTYTLENPLRIEVLDGETTSPGETNVDSSAAIMDGYYPLQFTPNLYQVLDIGSVGAPGDRVLRVGNYYSFTVQLTITNAFTGATSCVS